MDWCAAAVSYEACITYLWFYVTRIYNLFRLVWKGLSAHTVPFGTLLYVLIICHMVTTNKNLSPAHVCVLFAKHSLDWEFASQSDSTLNVAKGVGKTDPKLKVANTKSWDLDSQSLLCSAVTHKVRHVVDAFSVRDCLNWCIIFQHLQCSFCLNETASFLSSRAHSTLLDRARVADRNVH